MKHVKPLINKRFKHKSKNCRELLKRLLAWDPSKRIGVKEAIVHPYFFEHPKPVMPNELGILKRLDYYAGKSMETVRNRRR